MRSRKNESPILDTNNRLSALSIVIDDFDSAKETPNTGNTENSYGNRDESHMPEVSLYQPTQRPYSRQSSDASIKKILEEAEHRKHEFWKLIDEHKAVIENLKRIEQQEHGNDICKNTPTPCST